METLIQFLKDDGYFIFLVCVVLYFISGRRQNVDRKKAVALVYHALFFFGLSVTAVLIDEYQLSPHLIWPACTVVLFVAIYHRNHIFPYPKHCQNCGASIKWKYRWIEKDSDCNACRDVPATKVLG